MQNMPDAHLIVRTLKAAIVALHLAAATAIVGCSSGPRLPKTPNLYLQVDASTLKALPANRRTVDVDLLFATDREPNDSISPSKRFYDERRSNSLAVGSASVRFGKELEWEDLLRESLASDGRSIPLEIVSVDELIRFPSSLALPIWSDDGRLIQSPEFLTAQADAEQALREEITRRLANTDRKEVFIYIHGVGNSFSDSMHRMAELWHFLGRPGVPVAYTWPAVKGGGPLRGYTYARESSEFTVYHLRHFLQTVASCPDVERIHVLAHSRGTGVALSVIRDLRLLYQDDPDLGHQELKLGNIILAAPDIDLQVAQQRFRPDQVFQILDRLTLYVTPEDEALGLSKFLFSSLTRVGAMSEKDFTPEQVVALKSGRLGLDVVEAKVKQKGSHNHSYWIDNPSVLSDIILILRDDLSPGKENGRPMIRAESGLWEIHDGYPLAGPHAEPGVP